MASDFDKQVSLQWYLTNYKTQAEIEQIAADAFAAMISGKTVTTVSFEGGSTSSQITCDPSVLLAACQGALSDLGVTPTTGTTAGGAISIFQHFNTHPLES